MALQESGEMYLETILILSKEKNVVRAIDIAEYMGFSKPSVSRALNKLREEKYIITDSDGYIAFTESGRKVAERVYKMHVTLTKILVGIGVDEKTASEDACRMEHVLSDESFEAILKHAKKYIDN
ncbi:MAG: metal-dependent transcriptional regulator [Clostridiales bacterium]|nr:metal-dependent transcriptional regulator [Clostridiales bacterium]